MSTNMIAFGFGIYGIIITIIMVYSTRNLDRKV